MPATESGLSPYDVVGTLGVALYLCTYTALQFGLLRGQSYRYSLLNFTAASCVLFSLWESFNFSSALIQISWITISIIGIARLLFLNQRLRFTLHEAELIRLLLPKIPRTRARKFLDQGFWVYGQSGNILTQEGKEVPHFVYLVNGEVSITAGGVEVARNKGDSLIGEITYLTGGPATGTVALTKPSYYFCIETKALRKFLARNEDIYNQLEESCAAHLRRKLIASTQTTIASQAQAVA